MTSSADHTGPPEGFDPIPLEEFQDGEGLSSTDLAPSAARKIDSLCDEFERAWTESPASPPEVEAFWRKGGEEGLKVPDAHVLLKELLIIDINYRRNHGRAETVKLSDYLARFPNCQELIQDAFLLAGANASAGLSTTAGQDTARVPVETSSDFRLVSAPNPDPEVSDHLKSTVNEMPRQLGGYAIEQELGHGGMGVVYRARDEEMNRLVAIKVMKEDRLASREAVERFRREIRLLANLDHENIVRAYHTHVEEATGTRYLVMEYVEGQELETLSSQIGRLSIPDACEIIRQAALGLEHAHENDLIHRDLKPANLMLTSKGQIKVLDLGLARPQSPGETDQGKLLTQEGQWLGTPYYMSPEQGIAGGKIDRRTDIYSLGCTLYRFLTGRTPFGHEHESTVLAILMQHANEPFPNIAEHRAETPKGLQKLLAQMVEKNSADRAASAADIARRLEPFAKGSDLAALYETYQTGGSDSSPPAPAKSWRGPLVAGALLVLLLFIAAFFAWPKQKAPVDLLGAIDIPRDSVRGDWQIENDVLTSPNSARACLRLPEAPPSEFLLEITALHQAGGVKLMLVHRSDDTPFALSLLPLKATVVNGQSAPEDLPEDSGPIFENAYDVYRLDEPQTFVFDVKTDQLTISRDGEPLVETAEYKPLSQAELKDVPESPGFYLITDESVFEFSKIVLRTD